MSEGVAVLIPVLGRPHRVEPVLRAFEATTPGRVLFIPDPDDEAERMVIRALGADQLPVKGNYAQKIRAGIEATDQDLIFAGADDLEPSAGWFEKAKAHMQDGIQVVGVNDCIKRRRTHATHFLMTRAYATTPTIDKRPGPFFDGYDHSFTDDELIATATKRGVYHHALDSIVRHLHPDVHTAPNDATYEKGRRRFEHDKRMFLSRSALWM